MIIFLFDVENLNLSTTSNYLHKTIKTAKKKYISFIKNYENIILHSCISILTEYNGSNWVKTKDSRFDITMAHSIYGRGVT